MDTGIVRCGIFVAALIGTAGQAALADVTCGWHFNDLDGASTRLLADHGSGVLDLAVIEDSVTIYEGTSLNALKDDPAGTALGIRGLDANQKWIELSGSAEGPVELGFAFRATPSGFDDNQLQLLVEGAWTTIDTFGGSLADGAWHQKTVVIPDQDGPFRLRLFVDGAESSSGTIRFDNLRVTPISAPSALLACGTGCVVLRPRRN